MECIDRVQCCSVNKMGSISGDGEAEQRWKNRMAIETVKCLRFCHDGRLDCRCCDEWRCDRGMLFWINTGNWSRFVMHTYSHHIQSFFIGTRCSRIFLLFAVSVVSKRSLDFTALSFRGISR